MTGYFAFRTASVTFGVNANLREEQFKNFAEIKKKRFNDNKKIILNSNEIFGPREDFSYLLHPDNLYRH